MAIVPTITALVHASQNSRRLRRTSRAFSSSGMLLSTATLFLYNRYVTDTLTSIKGFDAKLLRSLHLKSDGMNLDTEIVAKLCRRGHYILEIPVEYKARTKMEGKKSKPMDGLRALFALFRFRFGGAE